MFLPCILELIVKFIYFVYDITDIFDVWLMDIIENLYWSGDEERLPFYLLIYWYAILLGRYWQVLDDWYYNFYNHMLSDEYWFIRRTYYCFYPLLIFIQIFCILTSTNLLLIICVFIPISCFLYIYYNKR